MKNILKIIIIMALLCLKSFVASAQPIEIWVTPTGGGGGSGTPDDPFSTPDEDAFFDLMHESSIPENSTIHLMAGTFFVREGTTTDSKSRHCLTPKNGWKIRGAGMDVTVLKVITNHPVAINTGGSTNQGKIVMIGGNASSASPWDTPVNNVEVSDLTIDCNLAGQSSRTIVGIWLGGANNRISRVHAINWGTQQSGYECFVMMAVGHYQTGQGYNNGVIEDCLVDQPAQVSHADGTTAFCVGHGHETNLGTYDRNIGGWAIRNCTVKNIVSGSSTGQPDYFHGFTGGGRGVEIEGNFAINLTGEGSSAYYQDTWTSQDLVIRDNSFLNVAHGVYFNFNPPSVNHTNVAVLNNLITVTNGGGGVGFLFYTNGGYVMEKTRVEGNIIYPHAEGGQITPLGAHGDIQLSANNNVLESGGSTYDFFSNGDNIYNIRIVSFKNNHNLRGKPLWLGEYPNDEVFKGFYEDELTFTPASSGWHKILLSGGLDSARLDIWSQETFADFGVAFNYDVYDSGLGDITMIYNNSRRITTAPIPSVRLAKYSTLGTADTTKYGTSWPLRSIELNIDSSQVGYPVRIRVSGMLRPPPYLADFEPYLAPTSPDLTKQLDIGAGIRTTGPIHSGSGTVTATTFSGSGASLTSINANNISSGTLADARLSSNVGLLNGSQTYTGANTFNNAANSFTGNGANLTSLNASSLSSGTVSDSRLSANVALLNAAQTFTGLNTFTNETTMKAALKLKPTSGSNFGMKFSATDDGGWTWNYFDSDRWGAHWVFRTDSPYGAVTRVLMDTGDNPTIYLKHTNGASKVVISGADNPSISLNNTNGTTKLFLSGFTNSYFTTNVGIGTTTPATTLDVNGTATVKGFISSLVTKTGNYTLTSDDSTVLLNAATLTATLPTAVGNSGRVFTVKLIAGSTTGTVGTTSSQTIDGAASYSLSAQYKFVTVQSDGANWFVVANN